MYIFPFEGCEMIFALMMLCFWFQSVNRKLFWGRVVNCVELWVKVSELEEDINKAKKRVFRYQ